VNTGRSRWAKLRRRAASLPALTIATFAITASIPLWLPIALMIDTIRLRWRFPIARLLAFGVCWSWIESAGVLRAVGLWARGRSDDQAAHYELMGWWSGALMTAMGATLGVRPRIENLDDLVGGNAVILARHASLGDSLLSGWALAKVARVRPRFVLKRELLFDPCLDIVGLRVPNHFLDRATTDSASELAALEELAVGVGPGVVGVIFAEGTRANDAKRVRALERIAERDPARAERLAPLRHLLPPRPAGSMALLAGAPDADVILVWHTGFDGLDTFGGVIRHLARPLPPVRFVVRRVPRVEVPTADEFVGWLDAEWLRMDTEVAAALSVEPARA
jgi:1-acyl-sn-glycerol-3-phosphate acyltransferase